MIRALLLSAVLSHASGFHKRELVTVSARAVEVLVTLDLDSGERARLLRAGSDSDGDGALSPEELTQLKGRLVSLAVRPLKAEISGYPLAWVVGESKVDLRADRRVSATGLSLAVLLKAELPSPVTPGMTLVLSDEAPDRSHVAVEVYQASGADAGPHAPVRQQVQLGEQVKVRLGRLSDVVRN